MMTSKPLYFVIVNILMTCIGYAFMKKKMVISSWTLCLVGVLLMYFISVKDAPVIRMFMLITTAFTGMKVITTACRKKLTSLTFAQWVGFVFTWAGMRAEIFAQRENKPLSGAKRMIALGMSCMTTGILLVLASRKLAGVPMHPTLQYLLITALLLIAFSLILHFGLLNISAGVLRYFGIDAYHLFKDPLKAKTLNEFWSRRWNIAFSEMTSIVVFRPMKQKAGSQIALLAAFIFSGILHELAISVPVNSGYGLPTIYFIIQGLATAVERRWIQERIELSQNYLVGKIWLFFWLIVPIPLLFHKHFVTDIIWTLAGILE